MVFNVSLLFFGLSFAVSWLSLWALLPVLKNGFLDHPNSRSSHCQPTPRGGGVIFVVVSLVFSLFYLFFLSGSDIESSALFIVCSPLIALPLAIVGFVDDLRDLPASWRYGAQFITGLVVARVSPLAFWSIELIPLLALLVIAVTAVINFINFMDGLDGLVAGCLLVVISLISFQLSLPLPVWSLVGSLSCFLFWNWSPAKVFMGDVGSTFLGSVFALLVLQSSSWLQALSFLLVLFPLLGDAFVCLLIRLASGHRVFQAHRLHLFQRLHQSGWSHASVSSLYITTTALLAITLQFFGSLCLLVFVLLVFLFGLWLDRNVAVPFSDPHR